VAGDEPERPLDHDDLPNDLPYDLLMTS